MPPSLLRLSMLHQAIYGPLIWLVNLSLSLLYIEMFGRLKWLRIGAYTGVLISGIFYFSSVAIFLASCSPRTGQSQKEFLLAWSSPQCHRIAPFLVSIGAVNIASDLYLIILPLPAVWQLQMPKRKKVGISVVFLTGTMYITFTIYLSFHD